MSKLLLPFLLLTMYLPIPRYLINLQNKISFIILIVLSITLTFYFIKKRSIHINKATIWLFFILPIAYLFLGIFNNMNILEVSKEYLFFISVFLIVYLFSLLNINKSYLYKTIINFGVLYGIIQIIIFFIYFLNISFTFSEYARYLYRHEALLISSYLIPLSILLLLIIKQRFYYLKLFILIFSLVIVFGKADWIFILIILQSLILTIIVKNKKVFAINIIIAIAVSSIYYYLVFNTGLDMENKSAQWRFIEILSYVQYVTISNEFSFLFGNGFGSSLRTIIPLTMFNGEIHYEILRFHNLFLYIIFKFGLVGFIIYLISSFIFLYKLYKLSHNRIIFVLGIGIITYVFIYGVLFGQFTMRIDLFLPVMLYLLIEEFKYLRKEKLKENHHQDFITK